MAKSIEERLTTLENAEKEAFIATILLARNASQLAFQQHLLRFGNIAEALQRAREPFRLLAATHKALPGHLRKVEISWRIQRKELLDEWGRYLTGQRQALEELQAQEAELGLD